MPLEVIFFQNQTSLLWEYLRASASTGLPLFRSKSFYLIFIKLGEYVGGHNILTKFYNQQNPPATPELWPLNCSKLSKIRVSALFVIELDWDIMPTNTFTKFDKDRIKTLSS